MLDEEEITIADRFFYRSNSFTEDSSAVTKVRARKSEIRAAYARLKHLWYQPDILIKLKGHAQCATRAQFPCTIVQNRVRAPNILIVWKFLVIDFCCLSLKLGGIIRPTILRLEIKWWKPSQGHTSITLCLGFTVLFVAKNFTRTSPDDVAVWSEKSV